MRRKTLLVGVLVIAVVVAVVVGGTYAIFSDTEAMTLEFEAGTINIELNGAEGHQTVSLNPQDWEGYSFVDWKPGGHGWYDIWIHNNGDNTVWIQLYDYPGGDFWTCDNADCSPYYTMEQIVGEPPEYGLDPANEIVADWNMWALPYSHWIRIRVWVWFPQCAGNSCQGVDGELRILAVGKQWRHKYGEYSCVALENKDENWLPILDDDPLGDNEIEGIVCYRPDGLGGLEVDVNAYGLTADKYYQLALNGTGGGDDCDNFEDVSFASMPGDAYERGWWDFWNPFLQPACIDPWDEGVYNFAGVYGGVQAAADGSISWGGTIDGLPNGTYDQVKFVVKEITGDPPGTNWTPVLMEMNYLNFTIP